MNSSSSLDPTTPGSGSSSSSSSPVPLSYISYEDKTRDANESGSPLLIHHSLLGCRKNWLTVAKVLYSYQSVGT